MDAKFVIIRAVFALSFACNEMWLSNFIVDITLPGMQACWISDYSPASHPHTQLHLEV